MKENKTMMLYVCGPMTGLPELNYPAFREAEAMLRGQGYQVMNPVNNGVPQDAPYEEHMAADLDMLRRCGGVAVLPGWERSRGALREVVEAQRLGLEVNPVSVWLARAMFREPVTA